MSEQPLTSFTVERSFGRSSDQLRPIRIVSGIAPYADGSVLISFGRTQVICGVTMEDSVPRWMKEQEVTGGWITSEYSMLPYSTLTRRPRDIARGRLDGRSIEIQRLIGRAVRAAVDLEALGPKTIHLDCDVLQADGGTRTAAITGSVIALVLACQSLHEKQRLQGWPLRCLVAAVSVGVVRGQVMLDLDYQEDAAASVDLNLVLTSAGEFVEIQGSGEEATFSAGQLEEMIRIGRAGIALLLEEQRRALRAAVPDAPAY